MLDSMRCAKCGLTQRAAPTCRKCGASSGKTARSAPARQASPHPPPVAERVINAVPAEPPPVPSPEPAPSVVTTPSSTNILQPEAIAEPAAAENGAGDSRRLSFFGRGGTLFGIILVNAFRTVITLGVYHFWGKVRVRAYLLSQTEFDGDRFAYHGTGKELFLGWLKAALIFGLIVAFFNAVPFVPGGLMVQSGLMVAGYAVLLIVIPVVIVGARRYRLSRISWRNIRFSFRGQAKAFIPIFAGGSLLTALTLGLYYPFFATARHAFLISHSHLGNQAFRFDGRGRDLFGSYLLTLLLTIPTFGLCWFWFLARKQRYWWEHTAFGDARFRSTVTGGRLLGFHAVNVLLLIATLGLGWAWVTVRRVRFEFDNLRLEGALDFAAIQQDMQDAAATREGLDALLDMDTGLAVG